MSEPGDAEQQGLEQDISPLALGTVVLRHRRLVLGLPLFFLVVGIIYCLVRRVDYAAKSSFVPQVPAGTGASLVGLAAQLGITTGAGATGAGFPLDFYAGLLTTREVLREAVLSQYRVVVGEERPDTLTGTLVELYKMEGTTGESRIRQAIARLRREVSAGVNLKAGMVTVSVTAPWPGLAEQVNRRLLDLVNQFNLRTRQSQGAAERRFAEGRLAQARQELDSAETDLEHFLEQNRGYQNSPRLAFDAARLQRRVELRQQVYVTLSQSLEQARINEVRDTPVITVVEGPERSARPDASGPLRIAVLALFLGAMVGVGLAFGREYLKRQRRHRPEDFAEFDSLLRNAATELGPRNLWAGVREAGRSAARRMSARIRASSPR